MNPDNRKVAGRAVFLTVFFFLLVNPASADVLITDFFSDFTSSDVTIMSDQTIKDGKAVFEMLYAGSQVESHEVPFDIEAGGTVSRVIIWEKKPQYDYYTARVSIYDGNELVGNSTYQVSYGTVSLPSFHVVDFSPSNRGVQLLLRPFNPSSVDIRIELLDNGDIVYIEVEEDVTLITNREFVLTWPFLLTDNKKYTVRAKIYTHRLYATPLINTYVANFTATEDVEILQEDVEVDEFGASVTIRGDSQVPFDGHVVVTARNRATNVTTTYRQQMEEILVFGKEDTTGVVWGDLPPGTYDVEIQAKNQNNITVDKYETVLRIPEVPVAIETPATNTPGFMVPVSIFGLLAAGRLYGRDRKTR